MEIGALAVNLSRQDSYRDDDRPTEKLDGDRAFVRLRGADVLATTFSARAADLSVPNLDNKSLAINPDDVRQSEPIGAAQTRDDDTFGINDVESTRAALDRRGGAALSLGIAGWVGEQVISAH
jgi:hypothetical protein